MSAAEMREAAEAILRDWEWEAQEMDARNPMRSRILSEAALLRKCIAPLPDEEGMVERVARAMFDVEAEGEPWIVWDHTRSDYERLARAAIRAINGGEP